MPFDKFSGSEKAHARCRAPGVVQHYLTCLRRRAAARPARPRPSRATDAGSGTSAASGPVLAVVGEVVAEVALGGGQAELQIAVVGHDDGVVRDAGAAEGGGRQFAEGGDRGRQLGCGSGGRTKQQYCGECLEPNTIA